MIPPQELGHSTPPYSMRSRHIGSNVPTDLKWNPTTANRQGNYGPKPYSTLSWRTLPESAPPDFSDRYNLIIANPPYVRHHHIPKHEKDRLQILAQSASGIHMQGLAGLYCYFLMLAHAWLAPEGIAGWLVPSEFMDVNYGRALKDYLLNRVTLLQIHRFDPNDVQFDDTLVSSAVVWFQNRKPCPNDCATFSYGGTLDQPAITKAIPLPELRDEPKWTQFPLLTTRNNGHMVTLDDLFTIKRGIATGGNSFFVLREQEIQEHRLPLSVFRPLLPSPRYLASDQITANADGQPNIEPKLFLLDCDLPEDEVQIRYPNLARYLETGKARFAHGYICSHRSPWYSQEERPPAPILCTYIGRTDTPKSRPFRFILNHSTATALNVYLLLYPKPGLAARIRTQPGLLSEIWQALGQIDISAFLEEGRVYGGGMHKLEPRELARVPADGLLTSIPELREAVGMQIKLFS